MPIRRRRTADARRLRLLFATDLHGSEIVFRKFLNAVEVYEATVAILGGDLTGKQIVPLVPTNGGFAAEVLGRRETAHSEDELQELQDRIRNLGQYPLRLAHGEEEVLRASPEAVEERFRAACNQQVADWMNRAAERLQPLGVPLFVTGGNDDYPSIEIVLNEADYVVNAEGKVVEVATGIEMISTGYGNLTPWRCPRDVPEEELQVRIEQMAEELRSSRSAIFNLHVPPYGSGLDNCPRLDTSHDPPRPFAGEEAPAGSWAVRATIERYEPMLSLHGHIHESPGIRRLGPTTAINPGSEYAEGVLRSAVVDVPTEGAGVAAQLLAA